MKKTGLTCIALFTIVLTFATCRVDTVLTYQYDPGLSTKQLEQIDIRHYNASNNVDTNTNFQKNASGAWIKYGRTIYTFNTANVVTELLNQGYDTTVQQWKNTSRVTNFYNASNNIIQKVSQNWSFLMSAWENNSLQEYSYDANKNIIHYLSKTWTAGVWRNQNLDSTTYTSTNKPSIIINRNWNTSTNVWDVYSRRIYYYSSIDSITQVDLDYYDPALMLWRHGYQNVYTYNSDNLLALQEIKRWNVAIFDYENYFKYNYTYFTNKNLQEIAVLEWNTATTNWDNYTKSTYEYYASGDVSAREEYAFWVIAGSYFRYRTRYEYKCISGTVAIDNVANESTLSIYPNPLATGILTVESNEIQPLLVMDISGKVILESDLQKGENKLDVRHLSAGLYVVKTKQQTQKLVIE